jgi:hypothetical protein
MDRLEQDNAIQRQELESLRAAAAREARIRFRGCNHPARTARKELQYSSKLTKNIIFLWLKSKQFEEIFLTCFKFYNLVKISVLTIRKH